MQALVLDGLVREGPGLARGCEVMVQELYSLGWQVDTIVLREKKISRCKGCMACWLGTPGVCIIDDAARDIAALMMKSNVTILYTPLTFGGYSSELKKALDRVICNALPFFQKKKGEFHHVPRYQNHPPLICLGVSVEPDKEKEAVFKALVYRNSLNFFNPAYAVGVVYPSLSQEEVVSEVKRLFEEAGIKK